MEGIIANMSLMDTRDYTTEQEIHHRQQDWTVNTSGCLKPEKKPVGNLRILFEIYF